MSKMFTVRVRKEDRSDSPFKDAHNAEELCNIVCEICKASFVQKPESWEKVSFAVCLTDKQAMFIRFDQFKDMGDMPRFLRTFVAHEKITALAIAAIGVEVNLPSHKEIEEKGVLDFSTPIKTKDLYKVGCGFRGKDTFSRTFDLIMDGKMIKALVEMDNRKQSENEMIEIFRNFFKDD